MPLGFNSTETRPTAVKFHEFLQKVFQQEATEDITLNTLNPFCKYIIAENLNTSAMHYFFLLVAKEYDEYIDVSLPSSKLTFKSEINSNLDTTQMRGKRHTKPESTT